ncbi:endonuclease-reverse transcriptase [Apostichopus japonicus]|uniref:Endonuclease-reverse transcriptase n=1 Tax=Stichopus japonicus TaxID=307972 RepID=A0A2G8LKN0_STIJA|nr:endonuclease-reverse transcriptase [Apostichopus japonicus]
MKTISDNIWRTGVWPSDWTQSEIITLPKVPGTQDCSKHRTISLLCHASKVLLEVIRNRLAHFVMPQIAEEQFGFVAGKGTTDAILTIRNIIEKTVKTQDQQLWLMLVDYSKAFDTVNHAVLWKTLLDYGTPKHLVWLLERLYSEATGVIRVEDDHTDQFPFEKGVRQGCIVSPLLFNACGEAILRQVKETLDERSGSIVGGRAIWNIRYADDTTLIARSKTKLEKQAVELEKCSHTFGLHINSAKTHVMVHGSKEQIFLGGSEINQVDSFKYLGSMVRIDGDSTPEICTRLAIARNATSQLIGLWKAKEISLKLKKQLVKSLCVECSSLWCRKLGIKAERHEENRFI